MLPSLDLYFTPLPQGLRILREEIDGMVPRQAVECLIFQVYDSNVQTSLSYIKTHVFC